MKITYTKPVNYVPFEDIPIGGCFIDHDNEVYMKIYIDKFEDEDSAICFADQRVYSGSVFICNVRPVEVELIVHAEGGNG